jgi:TPR repeat protein
MVIQGNMEAQFALGDMYEYGKGVEKDLLLAVSLYRCAAKNGNKQAEERLSKLGYK